MCDTRRIKCTPKYSRAYCWPGDRRVAILYVGYDPQSCGLTVTSSEFLRAAHNALSPPSAVSLDGLNIPQEKSEDAYHFVVYVPVAGSVYELDGLKRSPVRHGSYSESGEGWISKAREVIEARIATYPVGSVCHA